MTARQPFARVEDLPPRIPVFPLSGALLLPRGRLPLNIFEPRYLAMVDDAMRGDRLVGMIQPQRGQPGEAAKPALYAVGCAGRICSYSETGDGRYLITLAGVCRFRVDQELPVLTPYRQVRAGWAPYADDLCAEDKPLEDERAQVLSGLRAYLEKNRLEADWETIERAPCEVLVNSLAMICPFAPEEKQALLEAQDLPARAAALASVMRMALAAAPGSGAGGVQ